MALPLAALAAGAALGGVGKSVLDTGLKSLGHFINGASNLYWHKQQSEFDQQQAWETMDKQAGINSAFQAQQHNYNMTQQQQAQEFQKYMHSNSAQLKMQDLQKAGINPILASANNAFSSGGSGPAPVQNPQNVNSNGGGKPGKGSGSATKINASKLFIFK